MTDAVVGGAWLHCVTASRERASAFESLARVVLPSVRLTHAPGPQAPPGGATPDVILVDAASIAPPPDTTAPGSLDAVVPGELDAVRRLRAAGLSSRIVVVAETDFTGGSDATLSEIERLGATRAPEARLADALADALFAGLEPRRIEPGVEGLIAQLRRTRQVLSAGEIAMGLQHALNNPLAAIMAESQLLEMEELPDDQRAAVGRIVALCRRMNALVRRLDGLGGPIGRDGSPPQAEQP